MSNNYKPINSHHKLPINPESLPAFLLSKLPRFDSSTGERIYYDWIHEKPIKPSGKPLSLKQVVFSETDIENINPKTNKPSLALKSEMTPKNKINLDDDFLTGILS